MERSHYDVMGLSILAFTEDALKAAYRRLAMKLHPDRGGDQEEFKAVQKANEVLDDPIKRAEYDETYAAHVPEPSSEAVTSRLEQVLCQILSVLPAGTDPAAAVWANLNQQINGTCDKIEGLRQARGHLHDLLQRSADTAEAIQRALRRCVWDERLHRTALAELTAALKLFTDSTRPATANTSLSGTPVVVQPIPATSANKASLWGSGLSTSGSLNPVSK